MNDRAAPVLLSTGAALLTAAAVLSAVGGPAVPADAGTVPATRVDEPAVARVAAGPAGRGGPTPSLDRGAPPATITVDGASAPVVPQRIVDRSLQVPADVSTVGWWSQGAGLGADRGSIVLAGHVDSAEQGLGHFARLRDVGPGQLVTVRGRDRRLHTFRVTGRRSYLKGDGLPDAVFDQQVQTRLVLITCSGRFDRATGHYPENLVVFAVPVRS